MSGKNYLSIYAKSFNWAGFFLPKDTYKKCSDLYDFCRFLDNIADEPNDIQKKRQEFINFKNNFKAKDFSHSVIKNMWGLIETSDIPINVVYDLFDGVESDLEDIIKFETEKDLLVYSYRVAGTVGIMMAKVLNVKKNFALKGAIDLGIAMQLTNISRDVIEDKSQNRFYIKSDFEKIKQTVSLAERFYNSSFYAMKEIPFRLRFSICVARRIYREIGYNILKKKNFSNYERSGKIFVNNLSKVFQTFLSVIDLLILSFKKNQGTHLMEDKYKIIFKEINLNERF